MPGFIGARSAARYGAPHQRARALAFQALPEWSPCCRCHRMMWKHAKDKQGRSALHYDHHDWVAGRYLGFSHYTCNRIAGASKGGRVAKARRRARMQHRTMLGQPPAPTPIHPQVGGSASPRW